MRLENPDAKEHKAVQLTGTTEEIFATTRKDAFIFVGFKAEIS
jgi:hypothetical protein